MKSLRVIVSGRVQGVGYRAWTVKTAGRLQLRGWVRNLSDGTVEALFCGEDAAVDAMIESCKQGPMLARVDGLDMFRWDDVPEHTDFIAITE